MDEMSCNKGCGVGSGNGKCRWRSGDERGYSRKFSTCVSDLTTCTDHMCDDRESLDILICPQDCTSKETFPFMLKKTLSRCLSYTDLFYCCVYLFNESYEFKCFSAATIRGEGFLNTNYNPARGIDSGTSPCWCNYAGECSCFRPSSFSKVIPTSHITSKVEKKPPFRVRNPETTTGRLDFSDYPFTPKGTQ